MANVQIETDVYLPAYRRGAELICEVCLRRDKGDSYHSADIEVIEILAASICGRRDCGQKQATLVRCARCGTILGRVVVITETRQL